MNLESLNRLLAVGQHIRDRKAGIENISVSRRHLLRIVFGQTGRLRNLREKVASTVNKPVRKRDIPNVVLVLSATTPGINTYVYGMFQG